MEETDIPMAYRIAADLTVAVHLLFIVFVVLGGLLAFRWPRASLVHLPAVAWGVLIEWMGGICPLTPMEIRLRRMAGAQGYSGGFFDHYILPLIYPDTLTRRTQILMGAFVILLNAAVYGGVWFRRARKRKSGV
jgi:hypothetical protein